MTPQDFFQTLTGARSEALDLDLGAHTDKERAALQEAAERRDTLMEELREIRVLLEKKRDELTDAERMKRLGADAGDVELCRERVGRLERAAAEKDEALQTAQEQVQQAAQALREAQEKARAKLRETAEGLAAEALERLVAALNEAQRANMELYVLDLLNRGAQLRADVPPHTEWLIPRRLAGDMSVLQHAHRHFAQQGIDAGLRHGGGVAGTHTFKTGVQRWAQQAAPEDLSEAAETAELQPVA